jgi:hypothetical protein
MAPLVVRAQHLRSFDLLWDPPRQDAALVGYTPPRDRAGNPIRRCFRRCRATERAFVQRPEFLVALAPLTVYRSAAREAGSRPYQVAWFAPRRSPSSTAQYIAPRRGFRDNLMKNP